MGRRQHVGEEAACGEEVSFVCKGRALHGHIELANVQLVGQHLMEHV